MKTETDIERIKRLAINFLYIEPNKTVMSPLVIKHPFSNTGMVYICGDNKSFGFANILEDEKALKRWRAIIKCNIDKTENPQQIFMLITNSYKLAFLKYAKPHLSQKDFTEMLVEAWIMTEAPNSDPNFTKPQLVKLFKDADPNILMDEKERLSLKELDETVTVYRGVTEDNDENIKALSWTLSKDKAFWFAHRFGEEGTVYKAQIDKSHILAYFAGRGESEVIVDPKYLSEPVEIEDMTIDIKMTM